MYIGAVGQSFEGVADLLASTGADACAAAAACSIGGRRAAMDEPVGVVSYGRRLTEIAGERPDDVDLIVVDRGGNEREVTWRELETRANQIARALEQHGVAKHDLVALALPSCAEHVFVTVAIWKLGATLVPLRHDIPDFEMDRLMRAGPAEGTGDRQPSRHVSGDVARRSRGDVEPAGESVARCDFRKREPRRVVGFDRSSKVDRDSRTRRGRRRRSG